MKRLNKDVAVGQVWEDCDPRQEGRTIRVNSVAGLYAHCEVLTDSATSKRSSVGRQMKIRLDQFWPTSRGFRQDGSG